MADPLRPDLEQALAEWARRVRANREQVEQYREDAPRDDHYAPLAQNFRADPRRTDDPVLNALRTLTQPDETWLDIGAGGGRYALPLALATRRVIAVDPSPGMLAVLRTAMAEERIDNVEVIQARWPAADPPASAVHADVAFISHVGYDIEQIGPFLEAMERAANRCVSVLFRRRPTWAADELWPAVHGVQRAALPALPELLCVQLARDKAFELRYVELPPITYESPDFVLTFARIQTWVNPGGEKDLRLQAVLRERLMERDGRVAFSWDPVKVGILTWPSR
ncbi:MAG: class I SAM-dependent methyltransferase [Chloroflexota bacterium]